MTVVMKTSVNTVLRLMAIERTCDLSAKVLCWTSTDLDFLESLEITVLHTCRRSRRADGAKDFRPYLAQQTLQDRVGKS
jgi:hypothetical protein